MSFVFTPPTVPGVPILGDAAALFPVRRIYCVGRNYVDHAIEMGHSGREAPFFFMKPADAVLPVAEGAVGQMHYPTLSQSLHHELELVVAIGKPAFYTQVDLDQPKAYAYAKEVMSMNALAEDAQEGIGAFLTKRAPCWSGK